MRRILAILVAAGLAPAEAPILTDAQRSQFWQAVAEAHRTGRVQDNKIREANDAVTSAKDALDKLEALKVKLCGDGQFVTGKSGQPECVAVEKVEEKSQ